MDQKSELQALTDQLAAGTITVEQYWAKIEDLVEASTHASVKHVEEVKQSKLRASRQTSAIAEEQINSAVRKALAL
jgi:hypothetical protein